MHSLTTELLIEIGYAVGIGLFVGLEREHSEVDDEENAGTSSAALGARTFALLGLLGLIASVGGERWPWLLPVTFALVGGLVGLQYYVGRAKGIGLTTEVAALLVFLLGALVHGDRTLAVAVALITTILLISKPTVRSVVHKLKRVEMTATLQLLVLLAIVLPLLPSEPQDPWGVLPPRKIGLFVVLIAGISYVGYVLTRLLGRRRSAGLTGLVGGLTSSTAVTAAMAQAARIDAPMIRPGQFAVYLANAMMFARVLIVTAVLSTDVARALAPSLGAMGLVLLVGALWSWRNLKIQASTTRSMDPEETQLLTNPLALLPALKWGALLCAVLLLAHFAKQVLGDSGLLAAAAASGLADVDPITLAVTHEAADRLLPVSLAALAIATAVVSNTVVKAGIALVAGGRAFGLEIAKVFAAAMAVGTLFALWQFL